MKSLSQLLTSKEHGKRHQLPQIGTGVGWKGGGNLVFSIPLEKVFKEKFVKRKSDCLFLSGVINLSPKCKGNGQFP